jgi:4-alpha-glucanotransferase
MLGTKVWLFDPDVDAWPASNLGTVTTHDLPTVAGILAGDDGAGDAGAVLLGLVDSSTGRPAAALDVLIAVYAEIARSPARLVLATVDDLTGSTRRPNSPGTLNDGSTAGARHDVLSRSPGADVVAMLRAARPSARPSA